MSCGTLANASAGPREHWQSAQPCPPTPSGSAAWQGLGCCLVGVCPCLAPLVLAPPRDLGSLGAQPFPLHPPPGRGGCLAGLPLAEAQVQAVLIAPRTAPPPPQAGQTGKYQT